MAIKSEAEVLILGAFRTPSKLVAEEFAGYTEQYRECFDVIEYAVFHMEHEKADYEAFKEILG